MTNQDPELMVQESDDRRQAEEPPYGEESSDSDEGERSWSPWLWLIPVVAILDLVLVLLFGAEVFSVSSLGGSVELIHVVLVGAGIFAVLLLIEIILLIGSHPDNLEDEEEPAPAPERPAARDDLVAAEGPSGAYPDLETVATDDRVEGRQVLEMARPPKGSVEAGVYSTTYVEIDRDQVLRVEEMVAHKGP